MRGAATQIVASSRLRHDTSFAWGGPFLRRGCLPGLSVVQNPKTRGREKVMGGTTVNSVLANGVNVGGTISTRKSSDISLISVRLATHMRSQYEFDSPEFTSLCIALARCIDDAITYQEDPSKAGDLSLLVKQVCRRHCYSERQLAAVMVLLISVKNACQRGWFMEKDSAELCNLANEFSRNFCSTSTLGFKTDPCSSQEIISVIMSRFYPQLKMGQIISFLEVKPGSEALMNDFPITKHMKISKGEKMRLFVAQTDNLENSECLITPPQVNFLVNGSFVRGRTNVSMDFRPQLPTLISPMLKFGANLLQAVGVFNGNYIIAVAFMSEISAHVPSSLPDYEQPHAYAVDPDSEIIEGPSRISLNCPISLKRIKTPVKGHSCKHLQCFDFDSYIDINSKRPSWRCPTCNQYACFTDIRIDQDIAKVLKEVGEDVADVIISSDGSWKAIMESHNHTAKPMDKTPDFSKTSPKLSSDGIFTNADGDVFDLTEIDDEPVEIDETQDCKNVMIQCSVQTTAAVNNPSEINQAGALIPTSVIQTGLSSPNLLQLQQLQHLQYLQILNSGMRNEYGNFSPASRPLNRTPVEVQGLQAQMNTPVPQQRTHLRDLQARFTPQRSAQRPPDSTQAWLRTSNPRTPYPMSLSQGLAQSYVHPSVGISQVGATHVHTPRTPSPIPANANGFRTPLTPGMDSQLDPNWRPTGRMRGSLSGRAYSDALNQFIIRPTQLAQVARPSIAPNLSPQLQAFLANRATHVNAPGVLPERS